MDIVSEIVAYRARHNISQEEFARRAKLSKQTINSIENGLQNPTQLTIAKIKLLIDSDEKENS